MRIFLGFLVVAVTLGAAVWLHAAKLDSAVCRGTVPGDANAEVSCRVATSAGAQDDGFGSAYAQTTTRVEHVDRRASWQDPVVVVLAIAGLGAGLGIAAPAFRRPGLGR